MNETLLGSIPIIGSILAILASWLYMLGGRTSKWKRRFVGSLVLSLAVLIETLILKNFQLLQLLIYPLIVLQFSLGYGSNITSKKIIRRSIVVACALISSAVLAYTIGGKAWLLLPVDILLGIATIWLGIKSILPAAPEEFFICMLFAISKIMYPFVGAI